MSPFAIINEDENINLEHYDFDKYFAKLKHHKLLGYLYYRYKNSLPENIQEECEIAFKNQWLRNQTYQEVIHDIKAQGFDPIVLKGCALAADVYTHMGQRFMADIDLLVTPKELVAVQSYLMEQGYELSDETKWEANNFKVVLSKIENDNNIVVELHTRLFFQEPANFKWKRQGSYLKHEYQLLHLCGHLAYQHSFLLLNWLKDIDLYLRKYQGEFDFARLYSLAKELKLTRSLEMTFWALDTYFNTPVMYLKNYKYLLTTDYLWAPREHKIQYQIVKHLTKDKIMDALKYDLLWVRSKARS